MMTKQDSLHKVLSTVLVYDIIVVVISELALDLAVIIPNSVYVLWQKVMDSVRFITHFLRLCVTRYAKPLTWCRP